MVTLYWDLGMGAAGDMLTASLYELLNKQEQRSFLEKMNSLGLADTSLSAVPASTAGIEGTRMEVLIHGHAEGENLNHPDHDQGHHHHDHHHEHGHSHNPSHQHNGLEDIGKIIEAFPLSAQVKDQAMDIYRIIAEAESLVHGKPVTEVHLHEVGTLDAIADVTAVCLLLEMLGVQKVLASPIHVGKGHVRCAHGILPVPAPATANILKGVPIYSADIEGELCTPTGAAIVKYFVLDFIPMPTMKIQKIGYGLGKKEFPKANVVRALLSETEEDAETTETIVELLSNIDDANSEEIGFAMDQLFKAGALDVYTIPLGMKKSRPGILLGVLCREDHKDLMLSLIFKHTPTLGIREYRCKRHALARESLVKDTSLGPVRLKKARGYGVSKAKYEYEDIAEIAEAKGLSMRDVLDKLDD